jgi:hypothetical protein
MVIEGLLMEIEREAPCYEVMASRCEPIGARYEKIKSFEG